MTYRDIHPNDIILLYNSILKQVTRVDIYHFCTTNENGKLEFWSYEGDHCRQLQIDGDRLWFKELGFYYEDNMMYYHLESGDILKVDLSMMWVSLWHPERDQILAYQEPTEDCFTLNDIQQYYYKYTEMELPLKIE